jgi:hypothetical protein
MGCFPQARFVENTCFCIALAVAAAISEDKIKPVKAIASPKIAFCNAIPFTKRVSGVVADWPSKGRLTPLFWSTSLLC